MKQNFANRLAGGGFWALTVAQLSVGVAGTLREQGIQPPIGSGSDSEVFVVCGLGAFNHVVNDFMPEGYKVQVTATPVRQPCMRDRAGRLITPAHWRLLQAHDSYGRIGLWENAAGDRHVSTIWTGLDMGDGRIFETILVGPSSKAEHDILRCLRTRSETEARGAHVLMVNAVKQGEA